MSFHKKVNARYAKDAHTSSTRRTKSKTFPTLADGELFVRQPVRILAACDSEDPFRTSVDSEAHVTGDYGLVAVLEVSWRDAGRVGDEAGVVECRRVGTRQACEKETVDSYGLVTGPLANLHSVTGRPAVQKQKASFRQKQLPSRAHGLGPNLRLRFALKARASKREGKKGLVPHLDVEIWHFPMKFSA